jgi:hypothetical protein
MDEPGQADLEPWQETIEGEFPDWHTWRGVNGQMYARRPRSSPSKVARADTVAGLRGRIMAARDGLDFPRPA